MSNVFDKKESWGKRKRKNKQDKTLAEMVKLGYEKSARVKKMLDDAGIDPAAVQSREDIEYLRSLENED